jgi:hypothetical protein
MDGVCLIARTPAGMTAEQPGPKTPNPPNSGI